MVCFNVSKYMTDMNNFTNYKVLVSDVDGVLTDGGIYYDAKGNETKKFNVKDGQICQVLKDEGYKLGIITGRKSNIVKRRFEELGFDFIFQGYADKRIAIKKILDIGGFKYSEIVYTGDDINDLCLFKMVGFSCCPSDAKDYIKKEVDYVTKSKGGEGVFREVADLLLEKTGKLENILNTLCR